MRNQFFIAFFCASQYIVGLTNNNLYLMTLAVLLLAFLTATFLSARPATATLLPICKTLEPLVPFKLIYAALALGILCGSSMLPWSATGGPIMLSQIKKNLDEKMHGPHEKERHKNLMKEKEELLQWNPLSQIGGWG